MNTCSHLEALPETDPTRNSDGCEECLALGWTWVHLRAARHARLRTPPAHATAHSGSTAHPVVRSLEPGEDWAWCYVDELVG